VKKTGICLGLVLFFFLLAARVGLAATPITNCTTITSSGEYYLANDIVSAFDWDACILIQADDVVLDCMGHKVQNLNTSQGYGIFSSGINATIKSCIVKDCQYGIILGINNTLLNCTVSGNDAAGIFVHSVYGVVIKDCISLNNRDIGAQLSTNVKNATILNFVSSGGNIGISLENSNNITIKNSVLSDTGIGIELYMGGNITIENSTIINNGNGIYLDESNSNTIKNSIIALNEHGIYFFSAVENIVGSIIYNNLFNNTNNVYFDEAVYPNSWNATKQVGTSIVGGPYIGGNYWGKPDGTGYSDTCTDSNLDGICDSPYALATDNIDYLPLTTYKPPTYYFEVTFNYNSIDFGNVQPYNTYTVDGLYANISTNTEYSVYINGTDFSLDWTIDNLNLTIYHDTYSLTKPFSTSEVLFDSFPALNATHYHKYTLYVPLVPVGNYSTAVVIDYRV